MFDNRLVLNGETYPITKACLHVPEVEGGRKMYLMVLTDSEAGGFALWDVDLVLLEAIENLDGRQIHLKPDGQTYEDDTLGTDIIGAMTDGNYWSAHSDRYDHFIYGDVLVQFRRVTGNTYRVHIEMTLTESDEDPENLAPNDYPHFATAEFEVTADEKNPMELVDG